MSIMLDKELYLRSQKRSFTEALERESKNGATIAQTMGQRSDATGDEVMSCASYSCQHF